MIKGVLFNPFSSSEQVSQFVLPIVLGTIYIHNLSIRSTVSLLLDTGADITSLHLRDAIRLFGPEFAKTLDADITIVRGIGGTGEYFVLPAHLAFMHEDGHIEAIQFDLRVVKPAEEPTIFASQMRFPSVLGRDVMRFYRVDLDFANGELFLHSVMPSELTNVDPDIIESVIDSLDNMRRETLGFLSTSSGLPAFTREQLRERLQEHDTSRQMKELRDARRKRKPSSS